VLYRNKLQTRSPVLKMTFAINDLVREITCVASVGPVVVESLVPAAAGCCRS